MDEKTEPESKKRLVVSELAHQKLRELASRKRKTIQAVFAEYAEPAIDKAHRKEFGDDATASK